MVAPSTAEEQIQYRAGADRASSGMLWMCAWLVTYVAIAFALTPQGFSALFAQYTATLRLNFPYLVVPVVALGIALRIRSHDMTSSLEYLRGRLPMLAVVPIGLLLGFSAYTTIKVMIPDIVPFHADPWAAELDGMLHGAAPWKWAHAVFPDSLAEELAFVYGRVWFVYWIGTPLYVALWFRPELIRQYFWAFLMTLFICGSLLATIFSSVGPIYHDHFFGGNEFRGLTNRLEEMGGLDSVRVYADYLLDAYDSKASTFGTGISAIPSMHVAVVVLNAWLFSQVSRIAGILAWAFALLVQFGSVYTGWHYAIDGYVSAIAVSLIWVIVKRAHGERLAFRPARREGLLDNR